MKRRKMDLFSKLPDVIISHILSFLPTTKEAALTSVLAKRWRNLFAFIPDLDFDDSVFLHPGEGKREKESFMDFVDRVLALQGAFPIKKFSLKVKTGVDPDRVDRWICNVLKRGVSHLDLFMEFGEEEEYSLPYEISVSKTLVELKTGYGVDLYAWDDEMFLPKLKTLVLDSVGFSRGQFQSLLPACPVLEELKLLNMEWRERNVILSSSSLKNLKIITSYEGCLASFSIDTPNLVFLDYCDILAEDYPLVNLDSLVEVAISLEPTEYRIKRAHNVQKLIHGIRNVEILHMSPMTFELLRCCKTTMPDFNNLTRLLIQTIPLQGWQTIPLLIRNSPKLEFLFIGGLLHTVTKNCGDVCNCISSENKGSTLMSCGLKYVQFSGFRGTIRELHMIKHFLDYCPSLQEMEIMVEMFQPTLLEIPKWLGIVEETLRHYNETSSCKIMFKWILQRNRLG